MSYAYRQSVPGLWKDNHASYHFHTPVEYDIVVADKYKFKETSVNKFNLKIYGFVFTNQSTNNQLKNKKNNSC